MYGAEPKKGTLEYIDGEVETMHDVFTLQKSDLKMSGIPLILGEISKEPILKFAKGVSILQEMLARLREPAWISIVRTGFGSPLCEPAWISIV